MREIVLGTAGHVDHGKTSLVRALTGIDTDRLKEEKARGITIELGFAFLDLPCGHRLGIVDVPGHERFVKNMVAGATGIDLVAFVIAADEGVMPQTREHFDICRLLGVSRGCMVITKKDMVDPEWLALVQDDVRSYLKGSFLDGAPMVAVSAITGEGIDELKTVLDRLVRESTFTEAYGPFRLPVDRVFTMKGFGVVVTGTSMSGRCSVGEDLMIYPQGFPAKVRGIQVHGKDVQEVEAGHRTAVNLQGLEKEMLGRGDMVASAGCLHPAFIMDAEFQYLAAAGKKFRNRTLVRIHMGTAEIMGRIVLLGQDELDPGETAAVQLMLETPFAVWPGDHYVVRSYSPIHTIGGGMIYNGSAIRRRRKRPQNVEAFKLYRSGSAEDLAALHLREAGPAGLPEAELAVRLGLFGKKLKTMLAKPLSSRQILVVEGDTGRMVAGEVYEGIKRKALAALSDYHRAHPMKAGMPKEELRTSMMKGLDAKLFQHVLADLVKGGSLVQEQAEVRLPGHQVSLKDDAEAVRREMEALFATSLLTPPRVNELFEHFGRYPKKLVQEVIEMLAHEAVILRVSEELYFQKTAIDDLRARMREFLEKNKEIDAQGFKNLTGLTRKFSIPLLEYFDREKLTIRVGDKRVLRGR